MRRHSPATGLLVAVRNEPSELLEKLARERGWPLLSAATPRRLIERFELQCPEWVLYWVDEARELAATAGLIEWSRQRGARPLRLAVTLDLAAEAELLLRSAGAHGLARLQTSDSADVTRAVDRLVEEAAGGDQALSPRQLPEAAAAAMLVRPP